MRKKPARDYLIVANGEAVSKQRLAKLARGRVVIALDGAAEVLRKQRFLPALVLGDFDALSASTKRAFAKKGVEFLYTPDQDTTDLEKALLFCLVGKPDSVTICSALGGRTDHSLANLSFLKKFHKQDTQLSLLTERERIFYVKDRAVLLRTKKKQKFALLGFPKCIASSAGLQYEFKDQNFELGSSESISNETAKSLVSLRIRGEALVILEDQ